ncbi:MAG: hypothetical protein ABI795_08370 [Chthoniobacterales bacterium]
MKALSLSCTLGLALIAFTGCASNLASGSDHSGSLERSQAVAGEATPAPETPGGARAGWAW